MTPWHDRPAPTEKKESSVRRPKCGECTTRRSIPQDDGDVGAIIPRPPELATQGRAQIPGFNLDGADIALYAQRPLIFETSGPSDGLYSAEFRVVAVSTKAMWLPL